MTLKAPQTDDTLPEAKWRETVTKQLNQLWALTIVSVSTTYQAKLSDRVILADATSAPFTVTLPSAIGNIGRRMDVKRINTAANNVTVAASGAETIDTAASQALTAAYQTIRLISDGAKWWTL